MRVLKLLVVFMALAVTIAGISFKFATEGTHVAPTIKCSTDDTIVTSVYCTDEELLSYVAAYDQQDGDLTDRIALTRKMFFVGEKTTLVTYSVSDSDNNVTSLQKRVYFEDYTSPKISLKNDFIFPSGLNFDLGDYVTAECIIDGDLTDHIKIISTDYSTADGSYNVIIKVSNSMADTTEVNLKAYVTNNDYGLYRVRLENYMIYTPVGVEPDYRANLKSVINKGETAYTVDDVVIDSSEVDINTPGSYDVYYRIFSGEEDNLETISMSRTVIIVEGAK